jgi:hypothetical protein
MLRIYAPAHRADRPERAGAEFPIVALTSQTRWMPLTLSGSQRRAMGLACGTVVRHRWSRARASNKPVLTRFPNSCQWGANAGGGARVWMAAAISPSPDPLAWGSGRALVGRAPLSTATTGAWADRRSRYTGPWLVHALQARWWLGHGVVCDVRPQTLAWRAAAEADRCSMASPLSSDPSYWGASGVGPPGPPARHRGGLFDPGRPRPSTRPGRAWAIGDARSVGHRGLAVRSLCGAHDHVNGVALLGVQGRNAERPRAGWRVASSATGRSRRRANRDREDPNWSEGLFERPVFVGVSPAITVCVGRRQTNDEPLRGTVARWRLGFAARLAPGGALIRVASN